jgi:hypothetical protein
MTTCRNFLLVTSPRLTFVIYSFLIVSKSYCRIPDYHVHFSILKYPFIFSTLTCFFGLISYVTVNTQQVN